MGKSIAYLVIVAFGVLLLSAGGVFDGMFSRENIEERATFWKETVAREAPVGASKDAVDSLMARHAISLECFNTSLTPPVAECMADDPLSQGGTSVHPVALELRFTFRSDRLERFETRRHILR